MMPEAHMQVVEQLVYATTECIAADKSVAKGNEILLTHFYRAVIQLKLPLKAQQRILSAYARVFELLSDEGYRKWLH